VKPRSQDILLVEDNVHDVELTLREFDAHNFPERVLVLRDGVEAFKHLLNLASDPEVPLPRAILIGWKLPKLDGLELLRRLKDTKRMNQIPTYLLLSSQHDIAHLTGQDVQPDGYLVKPIGFKAIARKLELDSAQPQTSAAPEFIL
jgi:two-component system, response regulator